MKVLDTVVLNRDLPSWGLRRNDVGAVAQVYEPDGLEVFVTGSGRTQALVTPNNCESSSAWLEYERLPMSQSTSRIC